MKRYISFVILVFVAAFVVAQEKTTATSKYEKGEFISRITVAVNASDEKIHDVLNNFVYQYNNDLPQLFDWALKGLKLQGEEDDFIMFNLRSHSYNQSDKHVDGVMDINVVFLKRDYPDIPYRTILQKKNDTGSDIKMDYEMLECEKVIQHVDAGFEIVRLTDTQAKITFDVKVKLQRPFNLMTMKQYRENIEWRFAKFLSNLRDEAEKR